MLLKIIETFIWENLGASQGIWLEKVNSAGQQKKPSHQSKVLGWNVSQREDVFDRFASLILIICVLSIYSLSIEANFLYAHLYPS